MSAKIEMIPCVNPATGEQFDQVPIATQAEIDLAFREMRQNFAIWQRKSVKERLRILRKFQAFIIDSIDIITKTINQDTGKSRQDALIEVMMTVDRLHQYYKQAPRWLARRRVPPGLYVFRRFYSEPRPFGVVAIIAPWNYPFDLTVSPLCSALLAGNTVVLKPSEVTGATGALIEKLLQSIPELSPFVRVLHGDHRTGAALVKSKPDLVYLTGSVSTGRKVARAAAEHLVPYLLELGGKDPMIVLEDADIDAAARWGIWSACYNTGQTCVSIERVYVVSPVYEQFVSSVVEQAQKINLGYSPEHDSPYHMASLTFERQKSIIQDQLDDALDKGARILTGGHIDRMYLEPTVIINVDHSMTLMREEIFGPVMPIMEVKDKAEAIRLANDSVYGLSASVWSGNHRQAEQVAHQIEVGSVNINDATTHYPVSLLPFGGDKLSGNARSHGKSEVLQFSQIHSYSVGRPPISIDLATKMRQPGHYRLGKAIIHLAFGVTLQQRIRPITEEVERLAQQKKKPAQLAPVAALGLMAGITAIIFGFLRFRKQ
jgi:acyl-CoA reductase-like NAD-dependent aldehyde dehydrogenase